MQEEKSPKSISKPQVLLDSYFEHHSPTQFILCFPHTLGFALGHFRDEVERPIGSLGKVLLFLLKKVEVKGKCPS